MECLSSIIGITKNPDCLPEGVKNESLSGLYIDDTSSGRIPIKPAFFMEADIINNIVPDAVNEAIRSLLLALNKRLKATTPSNIDLFIGYKDTWSNIITNPLNKYLCIKSRNKDAVIVLQSMPTIHLSSGTSTLIPKIYRGEIDVTPSSYPFRLKPENDIVYIVFESSESVRNFKHVPCCGNNAPYCQFLKVGSGFGDLVWHESDYANGIYLDIKIECDAISFLCGLDYVQSVFGIVFAKLVQQIARRNIAHYILTSENLTPYLIAHEDELTTIINYINEDIEKMITYLPENYNHSKCFVCNGLNVHDHII